MFQLGFEYVRPGIRVIGKKMMVMLNQDDGDFCVAQRAKILDQIVFRADHCYEIISAVSFTLFIATPPNRLVLIDLNRRTQSSFKYVLKG